MADIRIRKAEGTWVVRAAGAVIAESKDALELTEDGHEGVIYFPRSSIAMAFLDDSDHTSVCPFKGEASYFDIAAKSSTIKNAAWSYQNPIEGVEAIKDHIAFYCRDNVAVEQL